MFNPGCAASACPCVKVPVVGVLVPVARRAAVPVFVPVACAAPVFEGLQDPEPDWALALEPMVI